MTIYILIDTDDGTFIKAYATAELAKADKKKQQERLEKKNNFTPRLSIKKVTVMEESREASPRY